MKWLAATIRRERCTLERARRRFVRRPTEKRLHDVRTAGRRFRSLLEDVAGIAPHPRLLRRVKRAAEATDAARDATILRRLLENGVDPAERDAARPLLDTLQLHEASATARACKRLARMRFAL
jgi:CHAD domain-containing protein